MTNSLTQGLRKLLGLRVVVGRASGHVFYTHRERVAGGSEREKRFVELDPNVFRSPVDVVDVNNTAPIPAAWHSWLLGGDLPVADEGLRASVVRTDDERRPRNSSPSKTRDERTPMVPID